MFEVGARDRGGGSGIRNLQESSSMLRHASEAIGRCHALNEWLLDAALTLARKDKAVTGGTRTPRKGSLYMITCAS